MKNTLLCLGVVASCLTVTLLYLMGRDMVKGLATAPIVLQSYVLGTIASPLFWVVSFVLCVLVVFFVGKAAPGV